MSFLEYEILYPSHVIERGINVDEHPLMIAYQAQGKMRVKYYIHNLVRQRMGPTK